LFSEDFVVRSGAHLADGYRTGREYFGSRPDAADRPTAVFCYNDLVAIGLIRALREAGLRVPEDVSVVGFDNVDLCEFASIPLTTMDVPKHEMGRRAAEMLIRRVEAADGQDPERATLRAELTPRASTAPVEQKATT
jgi:LacI family transcriptional regulator/LacI family repressor for deo operon, udp, cdd, tsx, nupC, and nupG